MSETVKLIACTFLLTPLREGRPSAFTRRIRSTVYFYSRPCGRGDKRTFLTRRTSSSYFYSRPCGRGDAGDGASYWSIGISTHAPAGGATKGANEMIIDLILISTHAPAGGATTTRAAIEAAAVISTHAPAGGAT